MSQQINLINPSLIKQKDFLTSVNMALSYALVALLLTGWYGYNKMQLDTVQKQRDQLAANLEQVQNTLTQATAARAPREIDKGLQQELAKLEGKYQMQTQILSTIAHGLNESSNGLAAYLRGFAKQSVDGLWLTGISIDNDQHAMTIRGRSLQADLLPLYIERLSKEPVFSGHEFGGLLIKRPLAKEVKAMPAAANSDISLAQNLAKTTNNSANTKVETMPKAELAPYVEFELKALEIAKNETDTKPATGAPTL